MNKINVIGMGFVGLTTALGFAKMGYQVNGVENDHSKLNLLKKGKVPFFEPYLREKLNIYKNNKFNLSGKVQLDDKKMNFIIICIGTPSKKNGDTDLNYINIFLKDLKSKIKKHKIIFLIKSTVPPGSMNKFKKIYKNNKNIKFCSNPEFLREGFAWKDFFNSGKVVLGCDDDFTKKNVLKIYKKIKDPKILVNCKTAEFIKYVSNSMLATMISFANDMSILADKIKDIKIKTAFDAIKIDKRWFGYPSEMRNYVFPGLGYGGYCLPKDVKSLNYIFKKYKKNNILSVVNNINEQIINHAVSKIIKIVRDNNIFVLGLSFKPNSDDIRSSKSIELIEKLLKKGIDGKKIFASDPVAFYNSNKILSEKINKVYRAPRLKKNTIYVLATAWPSYINFARKLKTNQFIDLRHAI